MPVVNCPELDHWQMLFAGAVSDEQQRAVYDRHLEVCAVCQRRLDQAENGRDELIDLARQIGDPTTEPANPTLSAVLERLYEEASRARGVPGETLDLYFLEPASRPDTLGTLGPYEVEAVIGQGGMGLVFRAFEPALRRLVAIKVLAPVLAASATARQRFTREAQAAAAVIHENVVAVHGVYEADGLPYLVMQYIAGESLQARLDRCGPLAITEVVSIGLQTARGLAAAHARGLIHRDIKPANILITEPQEADALVVAGNTPHAGCIKITDFGLARLIDDVALTQQGVLAGTPEYMAPEQARGEPVDHRADLFSLGSVLYALCTGASPFHGASAVAVLHQVNYKVPEPVRASNPKVPAWLETLIGRLHAQAPADRFQSAAEVAMLLEGYLAHLYQPATVPAPPLGAAIERASPTARTRRFRHACFLTLIICGLGSLILLAFGKFNQAPIFPNQQPGVQEFYQDFRGKKYSDELFRPEGPDAAELIKSEPEGLRITLPAKQRTPEPVGLATTFPIKGNFEITVGYSLLRADPPTSGWGVGFEVWLLTDTPTEEAASLVHLIRPNGNDVYAASRSNIRPDGRVQAVKGLDLADVVAPRDVLDPVTSGQMRIARTGAEVVLSAMPAFRGEFRELYRFDLGTADVSRLRMAAIPGGASNLVDLRVQDLRIRAPDLPGEDAIASTEGRGKGWLIGGLLFCAALLLSLWVWLLLRTKRDAARVETLQPVASRHGDPEVKNAVTAKDQRVRVVPCAGCGRDLRVGTDLAGRKIKCPRCGQIMCAPVA